MLFVNTLRAPYYDKLVGNATKNFTDMVISGEMIEAAIKSGKIEATDSAGSKRGGAMKKKEGEAQAISYETKPPINFIPYHRYPPYPSYYPSVNHVSQSRPIYQPIRPPVYPQNTQPQASAYSHPIASAIQPTNCPNNSGTNPRRFQNQERPKLDPIPITYTELFPKLVEKHLVAPVYLEPMKPPYPRWYDPNARCDYHAGNQGHSTEDCTAFKYKVQSLINAGCLNFSTKGEPSVAKNPLPNHENASINALIEGKRCGVIQNVKDVKTPMEEVFEAMVEVGRIKPMNVRQNSLEQNLGPFCKFHGENMGHTLEGCHAFQHEVQKMMNVGRIEFFMELKEEVDAIIEEAPQMIGQTFWRKPEPLTIFVEDIRSPLEGATPKTTKPVLTIEVPGPFPYKSDKAVPWRYDCGVKSSPTSNYEVIDTLAAVDITEVGSYTRSGRCYAPGALKGKAKAKNGGAMGESSSQRENEVETTTSPTTELKKPVSEKEACEFLKFIKHSEYNVVEQLNRLPARISILELLLNSEPHRKSLLKVLNEAYVDHNVTVEKLDQIVGNITVNNFIAFNDEEIPPEGRGSTKALHITAQCKGYIVSKVLIDNGSSLNVMPMSTLVKLPVDMSYMRSSHMVVRAFDGTRRPVIGDIEVPIQVGPCTFDIMFQVMDIVPSYNLLLGRPWIHMAGAIPSTLHQKVKFIAEERVVCVDGEEDLLVTKPSKVPYVEAAEEALECSFRSLEFVNATFVKEGSKIPSPRLSWVTWRGLDQMVGKGCKAGAGLGKKLQGITKQVKLISKEDRFGLGYKPSREEKKKALMEKREKRVARFKDQEMETKRLYIPHLYETFRSVGYINLNLPEIVKIGPVFCIEKMFDGVSYINFEVILVLI